jgi:hypothetical protein
MARPGLRTALSWGIMGFAALAWSCGDDSGGSEQAGGEGGEDPVLSQGGSDTAGGATAAGGASAAGGAKAAGGARASGGNRASGGAAGSGGATSSGGAGQGAGPGTGQPPGSICANDSNCSQAGGAAVCCAIPGCAGPCECRLAAQCEPGSVFLECESGSDCAQYGGSKVCCKASSGGQSMQFCTKQSGCSGTVLP